MKPHTAKIDVTKIKKEWLFVANSGAKYLDIVLFEARNPRYGETHIICQSVPKSVRDSDADVRGPILGNATLIEGHPRPQPKQGESPKPRREERKPPQEDDDVPF